jgi:uncharacterized protein YprB with RNaseH-like and TPR domain
MKIDAQELLEICEESKRLAFFDIETTGMRGDYNSVLVVSVKPFGSAHKTFYVKQPGNDNKVVRDAKEELEKYTIICGYYSKGFDIPMLNTRLLKWGAEPIEKKLHLDMYYTLKYNLLTGRRSQAHLLEWLETPRQKMTVGADEWVKILSDPAGKPMKTMIERCKSDCSGLEDLYRKTKHLVREIKR